ncbi:hypothetical protein BDZ94DRAFT_1196526 [Collybia nuda]|uniref:Uncharacterized protein n=1 Tax=Collybia nuda TaxID=64659 RepID=A0A9P5Y0U5_9AGAR|nr:hypothetical protein BDZ94DRAFT_1196526 [Collybia nuda]
MIFQYYGLREVDSCSSFDLSDTLNLSNQSILDESISISSLSSTSTGLVLPFPSCRMIPMSPLLLEKCSPMFPSARGETPEDEQLTITLTIPTSPRITKMLTEPLCVGKWVENLVGSHPPGHIPWGDLEYGRCMSWIPEGSIYPPDTFAKALSTARNSRRNKDALSPPVMFVSSPSPTRGRSASEHRNSFRRALVFERQITLNTGGKTKRWSLQVPATTMNPEMVDMMLELQDLNSFFKDGLDDLDQSVAILDQQKERLEPPSLMISDSYCALPLSLESSGNLAQDAPVSLATRRGKVSLPPISIEKDIFDNSYPSVPTAFLGSPSVYSPKFEFANASGEPTLDLDDMVANLRSQCVIIHAQPQPEPSLICRVESSATEFADDGNDDWAFSNTLLGAFGGPPSPDSELSTPGEYQQASGDSTTWNSADITVSASLVGILPSFCSPAKSLSTASSNCAPTVPAPAMPLPPTPLHTALSPSSPPPIASPSPKEVRGILKSCKNVRFASLPGRQEPTDTEPFVPSQHCFTDPATFTSFQRPSRLRTVPQPKFCEIKENTPTFVPSRAAPSPIPKVLDLSGISLPISTPSSCTPDNLRAKKTAIADQAPRSVGRQRAVSLQKPTLVSHGRNSLKNQESESRARRMSFTSRATTSSRWTMNEMPFRRGSNASQQNPDTPKSRMPVPLRNILTRFK